VQTKAKFLSPAQGQRVVCWRKDACSAGCWIQTWSSLAVQEIMPSGLGLVVTSKITCPFPVCPVSDCVERHSRMSAVGSSLPWSGFPARSLSDGSQGRRGGAGLTPWW